MGRSGFKYRLGRNARERRKEVGRILKEARKRLKFRQAWVGVALGYGEHSQAEVSRIEAGKRKIDVVELENFTRLYGLTLGHFETWDKQQRRDELRFSEAGYLGSEEGLDENEFVERVHAARLKSGKRRKRGTGRSQVSSC